MRKSGIRDYIQRIKKGCLVQTAPKAKPPHRVFYFVRRFLYYSVSCWLLCDKRNQTFIHPHLTYIKPAKHTGSVVCAAPSPEGGGCAHIRCAELCFRRIPRFYRHTRNKRLSHKAVNSVRQPCLGGLSERNNPFGLLFAPLSEISRRVLRSWRGDCLRRPRVSP